MFSLELFKKNLKSNYKLILIFIGVLIMYFTIICGMYSPNDLSVIDQLASLKMSPELLKAFGFTITDTSLAGFLSSYYYSLLMLAFPMIFYIILGNKLIAQMVDKGSIASILSTPTTRIKIAITQAIFMILSIAIIIGFITAYGIIYSNMKFPGELLTEVFLVMNLSVFLLHFAISGICFFASCLFNESRTSLMLGAGLPIAFLLIQMLSNVNTDMKILNYLTIFSLFDPLSIVKGTNVVIPGIILGIIGCVLYISGIYVFNRKDLNV